MTCRTNAAALAALLALVACGGSHRDTETPRYKATIQRTSYGIAHIEAADEGSLGFGTGYAYAEDNFCLLAREIVTVNGESSRWFGADGTTSSNPALGDRNLDADFFFRVMNDATSVQRAWAAQPAEVQALLRGYAAGVNRWLAERGGAGVPEGCRGEPWVRPIVELDLIRLARRIALVNSALTRVPEIANAQPPGTPGVTPARGAVRRTTASNGIALGAEASADGGGLLLGQPHLPWGDALRFWQVHLTIPGKMDVMGATLPGLPVVGIGFTQDYAWTHTTDTSAHYTVHALRLDPQDRKRYLVDGQSRPLIATPITVPVKQGDGTIGYVTRTMYATPDGPLLSSAGKLDWTDRTAFVLRDANAENHRMLAQWYAMNRSRTLAELKDANLAIAGNPWNYTIAADRAGNTLLMNVSPIANVPDDALAACLLPQYEAAAADGIAVLDGSRSACAWRNEPGAVQAGTVPASRLPVLERRDFVQNANDSAWLSNPAAPLTGFPAVVSREGIPQGARTRMVLSTLDAKLRRGRMKADDLRDMALNDEAYLASQTLPDLLAWCRAAGADGCAELSAWGGAATADAGLGLFYFTALMTGGDASWWAVPFDPADPVHTPSGIRWRDPAVSEALAAKLNGVADAFDGAGIRRNATLAELQVSRRGEQAIPIHGGPDELGILNAIATESRPRDGRFEVIGGTTYVQVVGFGSSGPQAQALLAYSQSSDPASPHAADQTVRFSQCRWIALPFTAAEIAADPEVRKKTVEGR